MLWGVAGGRQEDKSLSSAWRQITVNPPSVSLRHEINLPPTNWKDAIVLKGGLPLPLPLPWWQIKRGDNGLAGR